MRHPHDKRTFSIAAIALATLAGAAIASGCARRAHTRSDFGVPNRTFFDHQAQAASAGSAQGLDSEEASAIHQHYREALGKRGAQPRNDPGSSVLILQENPHETRHDASKRP
jgi:hypothetical protein